jgi:hypothetical protein
VILEDTIGVSSGIVKELGKGLGSGMGSFGGCEGTKGDKHGAVNGTGIVEEGTKDFLEA